MSIAKLTVLTVATVLLLSSTAAAQHYQPFIDPFYFDGDQQYFKTSDVSDFGNTPRADTGWFANFNRMYLWTSRPEVSQEPNAPVVNGFDVIQINPTTGDFGWGNRFDIGYMTDDDNGWFFSGIHIDGPNTILRNFIPRVNRINEDDDPNGGGGNGNGGGGGGGGNQQADPVFPVQDRNNVDTLARDFASQNTLNVADMSGFELNKIWRLERLHSGAFLEPFMGFRYTKFQDFHRRNGYRRLDEMTGLPSPEPDAGDQLEEITILRSQWDNHMVGGLLGARLWQRHSRWTLSGEWRVFAQQNFQEFTQLNSISRILYDGDDIDTESIARSQLTGHDAEFVWGTDVRAEAALELTRDISVLLGVQFMHYVQGVARGNVLDFNSEDLTLIGGTFGLEVNR